MRIDISDINVNQGDYKLEYLRVNIDAKRRRGRLKTKLVGEGIEKEIDAILYSCSWEVKLPVSIVLHGNGVEQLSGDAFDISLACKIIGKEISISGIYGKRRFDNFRLTKQNFQKAIEILNK